MLNDDGNENGKKEGVSSKKKPTFSRAYGRMVMWLPSFQASIGYHFFTHHVLIYAGIARRARAPYKAIGHNLLPRAF